MDVLVASNEASQSGVRLHFDIGLFPTTRLPEPVRQRWQDYKHRSKARRTTHRFNRAVDAGTSAVVLSSGLRAQDLELPACRSSIPRLQPRASMSFKDLR
jgi:hypothetical protein